VNTLELISLDRLKPRSNQVRREFHRIRELARSIELHSLLQNLVVRPSTDDGYFEIVSGERRYRALKLLREEGRLQSLEVPCAVLGTDGFIEIRKNVDIAGRTGGSHLFLVDQKETRYIDCSEQSMPYGEQLVNDIVNRTETAMTQAHCFLATEIALKAQQQAQKLTFKK